jgi:hypothetical protein
MRTFIPEELLKPPGIISQTCLNDSLRDFSEAATFTSSLTAFRVLNFSPPLPGFLPAVFFAPPFFLFKYAQDFQEYI